MSPLFHALVAPGDLPVGLKYWVFDEDPDRASILRAILGVASDAICLGINPEEISEQDDCIVIASPLNPRGVSEAEQGRRVFLCAIPAGYLWGYWDIAENILRTGGSLDSFTLAGEILKHFVETRGDHFTLPRHYLLTFKEHINFRMPQVRKVQAGLADEQSRRAYALAVTGSPADLMRDFARRAWSSVQYFDYVTIKPDDVVINGGIHGGYEIAPFLARMKGRGKLLNVDPMGFDYLTPYVREYVAAYPDVCIESRCALAKEDGSLSFRVADDGQATFGDPGREQGTEGFVEFPARRLTTLVEEQGFDRIDLIKTDLEGGETAIMEDLALLMQRFRPQIALSIYHDVFHYYMMPEYLMDNSQGYDFYFQRYSPQMYEGVLYCIPQERA